MKRPAFRQLVVPKLASGKVNDWESLGLLSSPTVEGDRVYLVTSRCEVMCPRRQRSERMATGPFKDEGEVLRKDVLPTAADPPNVRRLPSNPAQDADIIWSMT